MTQLWMAAGLSVALLAGCSAYTGGGADTAETARPYDLYLAQREAALLGKGQAPEAIPVAYPSTMRSIAAGTVAPAQKPTKTVAGAASTAPATAPARTARAYATSETILARYAAAIGNNPGDSRYKRSGGDTASTAAACAAYASAEAAQISFIARGGPHADPLGLDPDGDGFVCGWTPVPLRKAGR